MGNDKKHRKPTHRKHHPLHDYRERCIYHITLVVSDRVPLLGRVTGASAEEARVEMTPLGSMVWKKIQQIPLYESRKGNDVQILAAVTMPEHIHFVLFVRQPMKEKVGVVIRGFKQGCNKALRWWLEMAGAEGEGGGGNAGLGKPGAPNSDMGTGESQPGSGVGASRLGCEGLVNGGGMPGRVELLGEKGNACPETLLALPSNHTAETQRSLPSNHTAAPQSAMHLDEVFVRQLRAVKSERIVRGHALFEEDYDETRLRRKGQLQAMIDYVHNNPVHRWQRQRKPQWLMPTRGIVIGGRNYDAIGNVNLLALPRKQVYVRSRWSETQRRDYMNDCVVKARAGYALVSPFISPHEAEVRDFCLMEGHSVIVLADNGFSDLAQCPGGLYDYCVDGQVLILVPSDLPHIERKRTVSRSECIQLNGMATEICEE